MSTPNDCFSFFRGYHLYKYHISSYYDYWYPGNPLIVIKPIRYLHNIYIYIYTLPWYIINIYPIYITTITSLVSPLIGESLGPGRSWASGPHTAACQPARSSCRRPFLDAIHRCPWCPSFLVNFEL